VREARAPAIRCQVAKKTVSPSPCRRTSQRYSAPPECPGDECFEALRARERLHLRIRFDLFPRREVDACSQRLEEAAREDRDVDGGHVARRHRGFDAEAAILAGFDAPEAERIRLSARGAFGSLWRRLPCLDQRVAHRLACAVDDAAGQHDAISTRREGDLAAVAPAQSEVEEGADGLRRRTLRHVTGPWESKLAPARTMSKR
jgi:hypothetical protein